MKHIYNNERLMKYLDLHTRQVLTADELATGLMHTLYDGDTILDKSEIVNLLDAATQNHFMQLLMMVKNNGYTWQPLMIGKPDVPYVYDKNKLQEICKQFLD